MAIPKHQGEIAIHAHVVAADTSLTRAAANMTVSLEIFNIDGVSLALSTLDSTKKTALITAIKNIFCEEESIS